MNYEADVLLKSRILPIFRKFVCEVLERIGHYRFTFLVTKNKSASLDTAYKVEMCSMVSSKITGFFKNEDCPSSNELLEYQNGDLPRTRGSEIGRHLGSCDFCEAEVEFYSIYPQGRDENTTEIGEIPAPLFELAEALLKNRHGDTGSLNSLLKEKTGLVMDKA